MSTPHTLTRLLYLLSGSAYKLNNTFALLYSNRNCSIPGASTQWADPQVFETTLTASSIEQAKPGANQRLATHQEAFIEPEVIQVSEHVFLAYAMCNIVMTVGEDGVLIFDIGFRFEQAEDALASLRKKSDKPISGVVYSHGHTDHTGGPAPSPPPIRIYARKNYLSGVK